MADGIGRRLLGLDSRVLQLNFHLKYSGMQPPNRAVILVRTIARLLKIVVKSLFQRVRGSRATDMEASAGEERTAEKALEEYHQILQNTFGSSELLDDVMTYVRWWTEGT